MDETKEKTEEKKPEKPTGDTEEGNKPQTSTLIDDANSAAKRMEEANERKAELLRQEEEFAAKRALGGRAEAGQTPVKEKLSDVSFLKIFLWLKSQVKNIIRFLWVPV